MKNKTQRVNLFLDPDSVRKAKSRAALEGVSLSRLVELALEHYYIKELLVNMDEIPPMP